MDAPPAWTLLFSGLITGIVVGVFGCFLLYLSGKVPPLQPRTPVATIEPLPVQAEEPSTTETQTADETLNLGFYTELPRNEVVVDAIPVDIAEPVAIETPVRETQSDAQISKRLLQIGAFQQESSADRQLAMLETLGINGTISLTRQAATGRTLHLVQVGPFANSDEMNSVRALLQRNDINSIFVDRH